MAINKKKFAADVASFVVCGGAIFGFVFAVGHNYLDGTVPSALPSEAPSAPEVTSAPVTYEPLPMCEEEDGTWCVWPADWQGNGEGKSFWSGDEGEWTYIEHGEWAYLGTDGSVIVDVPPADAEYLP